MNRTSQYFPLKYIVKCRWPNSPLWENIAAFDNDQVAFDYATKCQKSKPRGWSYCVVERTGKGWNTLYATDINDGVLK